MKILFAFVKKVAALSAASVLAQTALVAQEAPVLRLPQLGPSVRPVDPLAGPHLLIDDFLVKKAQGLQKRVHSPKRILQSPVITYREWVHQPFLTVVRDAETRRFRMWYNYSVPGTGSPKSVPDTGMAYAESTDGIHWTVPNLAILGPDNRVLRQLRGPYGTFGGSVIDEGPEYKNKQKRFKTVWWSGEYLPIPGMHVAHSPDGLNWTPYSKEPVLPYYETTDPKWLFGIQDIVGVYWDPIREHYSAVLKLAASPKDGYEVAGATAGALLRRLVGQSVSRDFVHWSQPWRVVIPGPTEAGAPEFYSIGGVFARGSLLIGFLRILRDDQSAEVDGPKNGIGWTSLATSRDGVSWERHPEVFMDRDLHADAWDHAMTWIGSAVAVENELFLYYAGYKRGHKIEPTTERQIGMTRILRDRFVSRAATGPDIGRLETVLFENKLRKPTQLFLNATVCAGGKIRVQFRDQVGNVIKGAGFNETVPVTGQGLELRLSMENGQGFDLGNIGTGLFSIEFEITDAELFGFEMKD